MAAKESFRVIDISNPSLPEDLGVLDMPHKSFTDLTVNGDFVFLLYDRGTRNDGELYVVDVSDPSNPVKMTELDLSGQPRNIAREGNTLYILTCKRLENGEVRGVVTVVDITNSSEPRISDHTIYPSRFVDQDSHMIYGLDVDNQLLCAGTAYTDLAFIDVSRTGDLKPFVSFETPGYARSVAVANQIAYVADGNLQIIDVKNPLYPRHMGSLEIPEEAIAVEMSGHMAYVKDKFGNIHLVDVSDRFSVKILNSISGAFDFSVSGDILYILGYGAVFSIVDMTDPISPKNHCFNGFELGVPNGA